MSLQRFPYRMLLVAGTLCLAACYQSRDSAAPPAPPARAAAAGQPSAASQPPTRQPGSDAQARKCTPGSRSPSGGCIIPAQLDGNTPDLTAEEPQNGIYIDAVKVYDDSALETLLQSAQASLGQLKPFDQGSLISHLGAIQGSTLSVSQTALRVSGPPGSGAAPPSTNAPTGLTPSSSLQTSAIDILNEQMQLNQQLINLQLLLGGPLADQNAVKLTLGVPINISVPQGFMYRGAVAEVEVSVCAPPYSEPSPSPSLAMLLPQEKTYNVASLVSRTSSIGGGVVVGVVSGGAGFLRSRQTYYLVQDQDTLAMQLFPRDTCASGQPPVTFAWQFRPVLGQQVVRDGTRQVFAQLSLPKSANPFLSCSAVLKIRTGWRLYDLGTRRVGKAIGVFEEHVVQPGYFDAYPEPSQVSAEDNGDGSLLVRAKLEARAGMKVIIGGQSQNSASTGFLQTRDELRFIAQASSLAVHGARLVYSDGSATDIENPVLTPQVRSALRSQLTQRKCQVFSPGLWDLVSLNLQNSIALPLPTGQSVAVVKMDPHEARRGAVLQAVVVHGLNTHFNPGSSISFDNPGIAWRNLNVQDPTTLKVDLAISDGAPLGQVSVTVTSPQSGLPIEKAPGSVFTVIGENRALIQRYSDSASLVTLNFPRFESCPAPRDAADDTEVVLVGSHVYGLRDAPFYDEGDEYIRVVIPNDQIRSNRQAIWKRLFYRRCERKFQIALLEPEVVSQPGYSSDFAITDIKYVSYTGGGSSAGAAASAAASNLTISFADTTITPVTGSPVFSVGNGSPAVSSISPASGFPGETVPVTITGNFTHFTNTSVLQLSNAKVSLVGSVSQVDGNHLTAKLSIDPAAAPGPVNITVTTGNEVAVGQGVFTIADGSGATVTLSPNNALPGATTTVTVTGNQSHFTAASKIAFDKSGLSGRVLQTPPPTATTVTAEVKIRAGTAPGPSNVTITTGNEIAGGTAQFTVDPNAPAITSIFPAAGQPGQTLNSVVITCQNPCFSGTRVPNAVSFGNTGITASNLQVLSSTQLQVTVNISADAGLQKPTNTYEIRGSQLKGLKILDPRGISLGINTDTLVTFSLTDDLAKSTKGIVVQHDDDAPVYFALPDAPSGGAAASTPKNSIDPQPKAGIPPTQTSLGLTGSGMSQVVSVRFQDKPMKFTSSSDKALTLALDKLADGTAITLANPGMDVVFVYADKSMAQYFIPVQKVGGQ